MPVARRGTCISAGITNSTQSFSKRSSPPAMIASRPRRRRATTAVVDRELGAWLSRGGHPPIATRERGKGNRAVHAYALLDSSAHAAAASKCPAIPRKLDES